MLILIEGQHVGALTSPYNYIYELGILGEEWFRLTFVTILKKYNVKKMGLISVIKRNNNNLKKH